MTKLKDLKNEIVYYADGFDGDEEFVLTELINPENEEKLTEGYVPACLVNRLQQEIQLAHTDEYHDWTSELTRAIDTINWRGCDSEKELTKKMNKLTRDLKRKYNELVDIDWEIDEVGSEYYVNSNYRATLKDI